MNQLIPAPCNAASEMSLDRRATVDDLCRIAHGECTIRLVPAAAERIIASHLCVRRIIEERRHVYGLTTGFGPLANRMIPTEEGIELQQNLIYHLATGLGPRLDWRSARAVLAARLMSILQGASGASLECVELMVAVLNAGFAPIIPEQGTVGASGDLTPLAHVALSLQGKSGFIDSANVELPASAVFEVIGCGPLDLRRRDGLALVNGTAAMTGIAALNTAAMDRAIKWSLALSAGMGDVMSARTEAWSAEFSDLRPHPGQVRAASLLRERSLGSSRMHHELIASRQMPPNYAAVEETAGQDAYTLRCVPQIVGACIDTTSWHRSIVETELTSATDNPIFPENATRPALHGGNFMGQHVALASDALANAIIVLAGLAERQVARLTDERLNNGLPAFLAGAPSGLHSGFMGAQVTATAVLAELRSNAGAASVQSISTNGANQDVVSMGTISARKCASHLQETNQIQSILALCVAQAVDIIPDPERCSPATLALHARIREHVPVLVEDRSLSKDIQKFGRAISAEDPPATP